MPLDGLLVAASGSLKIDVIKLDKMVQDLNPDYDSDNCTYKGVGGYSLSKIIGEVYGEELEGIINKYL
jgi:tRNA A22 N-methylase